MKKPMIRHCRNCEWCSKEFIIYSCIVKYKDCDSPRIQALLCKYYKEKEEVG